MGISTDRLSRQPLIFLSILVMLIALFTSRAALSISMIAFLVFTCLHKGLFIQVKKFVTDPLLVSITLLFLIPFISGLWSEDKTEWLRWLRIKLPFLLLPLAFAGNWQLSGTQWKIVAAVFITAVFAGCCWSMANYLSNYAIYHDAYLKAQLFPTPLRDDHVRYSLVVCIAVILSVLLFINTKRKTERVFLLIAIFLFIFYLHLLTARTGLISLYLFILMGIGYLLFSLKKRKWTIGLIVLLLVLPLVAWFSLPTFRNRIRYNLYDLQQASINHYEAGANDGSRIISIKAGWSVLKENPLGVGSGDLLSKTNEWYRQYAPQMPIEAGFYPSSEWLWYGGAAGWPGLILFTIALAYPFFIRNIQYRFFWISLNLVLCFSLVFDIGLENQFGVFIHAFLILWWWKWAVMPNCTKFAVPEQ
jgi:O-antigen ligase